MKYPEKILLPKELTAENGAKNLLNGEFHEVVEDLFEEKRNLEERIDNFFGDEEKYYGDRGYQSLLERLEDVEEQIKEITDD